MKNLKNIGLIIIGLFICSCSSTEENVFAEPMYFPPNNSSIWETKTITELGWNESKVQPLLDYLELKNSKSFIVLHNGKIVLEYYFNGHTESTPWYWASAGKNTYNSYYWYC